LVLAIAGSEARADPVIESERTDVARGLFLAAVEAAQNGDWLEARELYARSYALKPAPTTLYSLAVAERATGQLAQSLKDFRTFLAIPPTDTTKPYREPAQRARTELERRVARVTVKVAPADAGDVEVRLDAEPITPLREHLVDPGVHMLEATAPGFRSKIVSLRLQSGAREQLTLRLEPIAERAPQMPPPVSWVALGIGSALVTAGVTIGLVGVGQASEADTEDEATDARHLAIAGDVVTATGALTAALGFSFWIAHAVDNSGEAALHVTPTGASLRVAF
jgi:hypothetical protein